MRKVAWVLAIALLGFTGVIGLINGRREIMDAHPTMLQKSVAFGVALYGVLGVLGAIGLVRRRPWSVTVAVAWAVVVTYVASVASFAFHDPTFSKQGTLAGTAGAFVGCVAIGAIVVWAARSALRPATPTSTPGAVG